MEFKLDKEFINELQAHVNSGNEEAIKNMLFDLHPVDVAEILDHVGMEEATFIYRRLEDETASEVLVELEEDIREMFLKALSAKEIAEQIDNMDSDDAADIIAELPAEKQESVISQIEDQEQAEEIASLMSYGEDTAGAWMGTELIAVKETWTAKKCIAEMKKQAEEVSYVYTIYVINEQEQLTGMFSMKSLLFSDDETPIKDFTMPNVKSVGVQDDIEEVAVLMQKYDLVAVPVINENGILVGRITIDDVMDVIKDESDRDYQLASGISEKIESSDSIWMISRARLPWLLVGLLGGILGAKVIGLFEHQLGLFPQMAFFIPLITAMGGNVGVQSSAIIVQSLANNSLNMGTTATKLLKEFGVSLLNGLACSVAVFFIIFFLESDFKLGLTVGISLISVIIIAGFLGTIVPLVLNSKDIDPAIATGPFITTMNDVFGLFIYFLVGWLIYF